MQQRRAEGLEVFRSDPILRQVAHFSRCVLVTLHRGVAVGAGAQDGGHATERGGEHPAKRLRAHQYFLVRASQLRAVVPGARGVEGRQQDMIALKAQADINVRQMQNEDAGGAEKRHGQSHLGCDQCLSKEAPEAGVAALPGFAQRRGGGGAPSVPDRRDAKQQSGQQRQSRGEQQNVHVGDRVDLQTLAPAGHDSEQHDGGEPCHANTQQRPRAREQQGFRERLSRQAPTAGAERDAQRQFAMPRGPARRQHARHVGACQQEQQRHQAH